MLDRHNGFYSDEEHDAYLDGYDACEGGIPIEDNAYTKTEERKLYEAWRSGWWDCKYS